MRLFNSKIFQDDAGLQFVSGVKLSKGKIYTASCRLQKYMNYRVNKDEVNYRVLVGDLREMTKQTKCEVDILSNRFNSEYSPDVESVDVSENVLTFPS